MFTGEHFYLTLYGMYCSPIEILLPFCLCLMNDFTLHRSGYAA